MKKLKVILTVMVCIILTGCNTSYIDNKKVTTTEETSYSENPEGPTTEQAPGLFSFSSSSALFKQSAYFIPKFPNKFIENETIVGVKKIATQ